MFRISNKTPNMLKSKGPGQPGLRALIMDRRFRTALLIIVLAAVGYGIWYLGDDGREERILAAQIQSPLPPEWQENYFHKNYCTRENYCGQKADPDRDGLNNYGEFLFFTDPTNPDTDGDGSKDGDEVKNYTNPIGIGTGLEPRDVSNFYEYNPITDELIQSGLEG